MNHDDKDQEMNKKLPILDRCVAITEKNIFAKSEINLDIFDSANVYF